MDRSHAEPMVRLSVLIKNGAIFLAVGCMTSIALWIVSGEIILSPFASMLGIVASTFFYLMGLKIEADKSE